MANEGHGSCIIRFDIFELNLQTGELLKGGQRVPLSEQPFLVLQALVEHPGELVSRTELCQRIWPSDTFVDFEQGLNKAVNKLRHALGDTAAQPCFIETLARRGYRFIAPVTNESSPGVTLRLRDTLPRGGGCKVLPFPPATQVRIVVLPFIDLSIDAGLPCFGDGLAEELIVHLGTLRPRCAIIARTSALHCREANKSVEQIRRELSVHYILEGSIRCSAESVRVIARLIDTLDQTYVWAGNYERDRQNVPGMQRDVAVEICACIAGYLASTELPGLQGRSRAHHGLSPRRLSDESSAEERKWAGADAHGKAESAPARKLRPTTLRTTA